MPLKEQFLTEWSEARKKRKGWQPRSKVKNIFEGQSSWQKGSINDVELIKLSVLPNPSSKAVESFSVIKQPDWKDIEEPSLPFDLKWQQSLSAKFDFYFDMPANLKCFALGERFSGLNLRGTKHTLISTDNPDHDEVMDAMYKSIPFLVLADKEKFWGIYLDSSAPCCFDLDSELILEGHIELFTRRSFDLYIIGTSSLPQLVEAFTSLVGNAKLPPLWALGHQQSRWSYPDEMTVYELASEFRKRKIPCDTIVLDIDYMEDYKVFTVSRERFPQFEKMVDDLAADNFKVVTIVDPGVKQDSTYPQFVEGKNKDLFCKTPDNELFLEKVWPGISAFPDFLKAETRSWWAKHHQFYTDLGVAGIWNDMNEPSFFGIREVLPEEMKELPEPEKQYCFHETNKESVPHLEARNLYGFLMCKATYDGLKAARPNERPFVLTRSGCAGIQRYAAVWLGDNKSRWEHLRKSIPMILNLGLSGVSFSGVDIGGFGESATPETLVRWYETGIFYPFFRNHCALFGRAQEPFAYTEKVEDMIRKLIETRYRLLPYINSLFWESMRTGAPLMRPLIWHYPNDPIVREIDDQFMFGQDILVAPILDRAHEYRTVYFPEGNWYAFESNEKFEGERSYNIKIPLGTVPAFMREGAIIPMTESMQSTNEYGSKLITFKIYGNQASGTYFEDDGISFDYEKGKYNEYQLSYAQGKLSYTSSHKDYASAHQYRYQKTDSDKQIPFAL